MKGKVLILFLLTVSLLSCDNQYRDPKASGKFESINSGTFTTYVDEAIWEFMSEPLRLYDSAYIEIHPNFIKANARKCMAMLMSGETNAIVTPRDYLEDEDSLMKAFKVDKHERAIYAIDGLVFFTNKNFPLDTLTDEQIKRTLSENNYSLKEVYPSLFSEPEIYCADRNSSEHANLKQIVLSTEPLSSKLTFAENKDRVKELVKNNANSIGIGFLSQVVNDTNFKFIMISFLDSNGKYIFPRVVHQANILRNLYPYIVNHYIYILEKRKDRVYWFAKFLEREYIVQLYFNKAGIVPAYARIKLIEP